MTFSALVPALTSGLSRGFKWQTPPEPETNTIKQLIQAFPIAALHRGYLSEAAVLLLYCHHHFFTFLFSQTAKLKKKLLYPSVSQLTGAPPGYEEGSCSLRPASPRMDTLPSDGTLADMACNWLSCFLSCFWSISVSDLVLRSWDSLISSCLCKEEMVPVGLEKDS